MQTLNKSVVRQYVEAFNSGDFAMLLKHFSPDAIVYGVLGSGTTQVALPIWRELHAELKMTLSVESMIAEDDTVAVRYVERGKSVGSFRGQPATNKSYELPAMEWFRLEDGLIRERWGVRDAAAQASQLGW